MPKNSKITNIKIPFSNKTKSKLTQWSLDWAEKRPKTANGVLGKLQKYREREREDAKNAHERSRPPKGTELNLLGFQLFEVFNYENYQELLSNLYSIFPNIDDNEDESFSNYFKEFSESITNDYWHYIGEIFNNHPPTFIARNRQRVLSSLHSYIQKITIHIQKPLPSLIIMRFQVHLTEEVISKINEIQSQSHLSRTTIQEIYFLNSIHFGSSHTHSDAILAQNVLKYIASIRKSAEDSIKLFIQGYFLSQISNTCKLPSIEIYTLKGVYRNRSNFVSFAKSARGWWSSFGFNFSKGSLFGNNKMVFSWRPLYSRRYTDLANRLIIFPEKFLGARERRDAKPNQTAMIWEDLVDFSVEISNQIIIIEFLQNLLKSLERIRRLVFDAIKGQPNIISSLNKYSKLYREFQQTARILRRFSLEFEENEKYIEHDLRQVKDYIEIDINHNGKKKNTPNLAEIIISRIKYLNKLLLGQIDFIEKSFSTHIEFFNIDAVYRLQKITVWLTLIATFIATISILINFTEILETLNYLYNLFLFSKN